MGPELCSADKGQYVFLILGTNVNQTMSSTRFSFVVYSLLCLLYLRTQSQRKLSFFKLSEIQKMIKVISQKFPSGPVLSQEQGEGRLLRRNLKQPLLFRSLWSLWGNVRGNNLREHLGALAPAVVFVQNLLLFLTFTPTFSPKLHGKLVIIQDLF